LDLESLDQMIARTSLVVRSQNRIVTDEDAANVAARRRCLASEKKAAQDEALRLQLELHEEKSRMSRRAEVGPLS
jgi:hypothetical protein